MKLAAIFSAALSAIGALALVLLISVTGAYQQEYAQACRTGGVSVQSVNFEITGEGFTPEQIEVGKTAVSVALNHTELSPEDRRKLAVIVLITSMVESEMRNLSYGDRDSVGHVQQRSWWGTFEQRTDVAESTELFISGGAVLPQRFNGRVDGSEPGVLDIPGWQSMPPGDVAQAVQRSAYPDRYAQKVAAAERFLGANFQVPEDGALVQQVTNHLDCRGVGDNRAQAFVAAALSQIGQPYVWGGESVEEGGFDCSGLIHWAYDRVGIPSERMTADSLYRRGSKVSSPTASSLLPGDLVFWGSEEKITHVAIWLGNDQILEARRAGTLVGINKMRWGPSFVGATRLPENSNDLVLARSASVGDWQPPLRGNVRLTSHYGMRVNPVTGVYQLHDGTDLTTFNGDKIYAPLGGTVVFSGRDPKASWRGNFVRVYHGVIDGKPTYTRYHNMIRTAVSAGDTVMAGRVLGYIGETGTATGPHVHFVIEWGEETVDPVKFYQSRGKSIR